MLDTETRTALANLRQLAREMRVKLDAMVTAADSVVTACDMVESMSDASVANPLEQAQASIDSINGTSREVVQDVRLLDMYLADIWAMLDL